MKETTKITVRFPADVIVALKALAKREDRSLNCEIVQAVREYIAKREERKGNA